MGSRGYDTSEALGSRRLGTLLVLVVLLCASGAAPACVNLPLYANIMWSKGVRPGQWYTGDLQVCLGDKVWFKAVDDVGWEANTEDYDIDTCNGGQLYDTAHYYWDFNYDGTQDTGVDDVIVSHTFSQTGQFVVRLLVHDEVPTSCYVDDNDPFASVTVNVADDSTPPTVSITSPAGIEWHMAPNTSSILISGYADDLESGIASVDVTIYSGSTETGTASYVAQTASWSYLWNNPPSGTATIEACATNNCDNTACASRTVTVYSGETRSVVYVNGSRPDNSGDGWSWLQAKKTLQAGINLGDSTTTTPKAEVWVAAGTYVENISLANGVAVYGGFTGTETVREQRNWQVNETIIDGAQQGSVVTADSSVTSATTRIDGFVIQNGSGTEDDNGCNGGGVHCLQNSCPVIANNLITQNSANLGGGVCSWASATITNNCIVDNSSAEGGGVWASSGTISNNTILDNQCGGLGGGIRCEGSCAISNNIIAFNASSQVHADQCLPSLHNNCLYGNELPYSWYPFEPTPVDDITDSDPLLVDRANGNYHLQSGSPCIDTGWNSAAGLQTIDMDAQARVWSAGGTATIDIGADESQEGTWYTLGLKAVPVYCCVGETSTVTATVKNPLTNLGVPGLRVNISLDGGTLLSISNNGWHNETAGYAYTDTYGQVSAGVTRGTEGKVTVTATCWPSSIGEGPVTRSIVVRFLTSESMMNWPMFMHDAQHTGMTPFPDTVSEGLTTTTWSASLLTAETERTYGIWSDHNHPGNCEIFEHPYIDSSPVVMGNKVVVGEWTSGKYGGSYPDYHPYEPSTSLGCVKAFNAETGGTAVWCYPSSGHIGGVASTPCISNGNVYVGSADGNLYCFDLASGGLTHSYSVATTDRQGNPSKIIASPVVYDGVVYIGNEAAKVYAFNANNLTVASGWSDTGIALPIDAPERGDRQITSLATKNMTGVSSAAVATITAGETSTSYLLFGCDDGYIYRVTLGLQDAEDTELSLVGVDLGACVESSPTVVDDEVYVGISLTGGNEVYRLSVEPLRVLGRGSMGEECRATIATDFAHLYAGVDTGHSFHKLWRDTMWDAVDPFWAMGGESYFVGSAAVCQNGLVYVGNDDGKFRALSEDDLTVDAMYQTYTDPWNNDYVCSSPAIAYNVDANHDRWVYVTSRAGGGQLLAFRTTRSQW